MTIEIITKRIIEDLRIKSHLEAQRIKELPDRDDARIDEDDMDEVRRDIITAASLLSSSLQRFLKPDYAPVAENDSSLPESFIYEFEFSERRSAGKAQPLTDAIHTFIVDKSLSLFYASSALADMSVLRDKQAAADIQLIENLIYAKRSPL